MSHRPEVQRWALAWARAREAGDVEAARVLDDLRAELGLDLVEADEAIASAHRARRRDRARQRRAQLRRQARQADHIWSLRGPQEAEMSDADARAVVLQALAALDLVAAEQWRELEAIRGSEALVDVIHHGIGPALQEAQARARLRSVPDPSTDD